MQVKKRAVINFKNCKNCLPCLVLDKCPKGGIEQEEDGYVYIDNSCLGCGTCIRECPYKAIEIK